MKPTLSPEKIIATVAESNRLAVADLLSKSQLRHIADARAIAMSLIVKEYPYYTLDRIGSFFNRNHSTVSYCIKKCKDLQKTDRLFANHYERCHQKIKFKIFQTKNKQK